jgi:hypothetical protein
MVHFLSALLFALAFVAGTAQEELTSVCTAGAACTNDEADGLQLLQKDVSFKQGLAAQPEEIAHAESHQVQPSGKKATTLTEASTDPGKTSVSSAGGAGAGNGGKGSFQRTWMACKEPQQQPRTEEEKAAGIDAVEVAKCTDQMSFKDLCCQRWADSAFKNKAFLNLAAGQDRPKKKVGLQQTEAAEVVKVCTQNTDGLALMKEGHSHAVSMPLECIDADITVEQLKGDAGVLEPGEIVLRERLLYFAKQQIPLSSVPRCQDEVKEKCPDGDKPTTVQPAWVQKVEDKIKNGEFPSGAVEDDNDDSDEALIAAQTGVGHRRHHFFPTTGMLTLSSGGGSTRGGN